jgi:hAT family C-terminal dimerisation region
MIERAIYLRPALNRLITNHFKDLNEYRLTDSEWAIAEQVLMILTPFQRCTTRFESNSRSSEVDYVFFAYDTMFNHLEDVQGALSRSRLSTARYLNNAINTALGTLRTYYDKTTTMPHVYADAMILNPRVRLSIFNLESWGDEDANSYRDATKSRFMSDYMNQPLERIMDGTGQNSIPTDDALLNEEEDYAEHLRKRSKKVADNDCEFDKYLSNPNGDNQILDILAWWKTHSIKYPRLSHMARDYLAVPPSGCAVEREFSVSGRIATWQRNRLSPARISASMIYKSAMKREGRWVTDDISQTDDSLMDDLMEDLVDDSDDNRDGNIPAEWRDNWWKQKITGASRRN